MSKPAQEPLGKLFLRFLHFGFLAWGGPVAQIAMIREELVEKEKWISKERFNRALAVYQALPGPEAHELCVYFGMIARGRPGAFLAGLGFMLPGFVLMFLLSWFYVRFGMNSALFLAVFQGFQPAVAALIVRAVHRIGRHALTNTWLWSLGGLGTLGEILKVPFSFSLPAIGLIYALRQKNRALATAGVALLIAAFGFWFFREGGGEALKTFQSTAFHKPAVFEFFFYGLRAGLLTFGGAYTAIPFLQHDAVLRGGWMTNAQFLEGIALSGILPAPLIIFSTFVGYLGGGPAGALAMTVGIFLPAFLFTMIGYGTIEKIMDFKPLHAFLDGLAAGVVGLIAVSAFRLFPAAVTSGSSLAIFALALLALYRFKAKTAVVFVMLAAGLLGLLF